MGGEKQYSKQLYQQQGGSPPRGRGKVSEGKISHFVTGITPAWAGKSFRYGIGYGLGEDHPRVGGEKSTVPATGSSYWGSPPRGRGKVIQLPSFGGASRITPAWAGKSCYAIFGGRVPWDHPRVGGEKMCELGNDHAGQGSPPRGRGKARRLSSWWTTSRITPAWAGKSLGTGCDRCQAEDHPRVGGEKPAGGRLGTGDGGSPPRGRGKALLRQLISRWGGITPAWAGKREEVPYDIDLT